MGRYDLRPARVRQTAQMLLSSQRIKQAPAWFKVMHDVPPSEMLVRTLPVQHIDQPKHKRVRKASRLFQPQRMAYQEDALRLEFFSDHPWELARPRVLVEVDGKDHHKWDWSKKFQPGRPQGGESVVQRQNWFMTPGKIPEYMETEKLTPSEEEEAAEHNKMVDEMHREGSIWQKRTEHTRDGNGNEVEEKWVWLLKDAAYDVARKELYEQRHSDEVEARVAREEALHTGAWFGKDRNEIGMELENATFDKWKVWARQQVVQMEQARNAAYSGLGGQTTADELSNPQEEHRDGDPLNTAVDILGKSVPNNVRGQTARGGAAVRP